MLKPGQIATLLPIILVYGCMSYSEVELVSVQNAELTRFDGRGLSATITAEVYNPNNFRIHVMDPDMDLYINDVAMGKATLDSTIVLAPNSSRTYTVPLHATFTNGQAGLIPLLMTSALNGTIKLGIKGTVLGKARSLRKRIPFEMEQAIDLRR